MKTIQYLNLLQAYLRHFNYPFSQRKLRTTILSSSYDGLMVFADALDRLSIEYVIAEFPEDFSSLSELPEMFLTTLKHQSTPCLVTIKDQAVTIQHLDGNEKQQLTLAHFLENWGRVCLLLEKQKKKLKPQRTLFFLGVLLCLFAICYRAMSFDSVSMLIMSFTFLSLLVGLTILYVEYNSSKTLALEKFCQKKDYKNGSIDCTSLITNHGTLIFQWLKISDLLIVFQLTSLVAILVTKDIKLNLILNALAFPFIAYSLVTQFKLKLWCKLCLMFIVLYVLNTALAFSLGASLLPAITSHDFILILAIGGAISVSWAIARWILYLVQNNHEQELELETFRRDQSLFQSFLNIAQECDFEQLPSEYLLLSDDPSQANHVTLVISPFCVYCKALMNKLVEKTPQVFTVRILISANLNSGAPTPGQLVASALIGIYLKEGWNSFLASYLDFQKTSNKKNWFDEHKEFRSPASDQLLAKQNEFLRSNNISISPLAFFQNRLINRPYRAEDIFNFIN